MIGLDGFIDDAVDYAERVELERVTGHAPILDLQILLVEIAKKCWSVVSSVRLGEEVKLSRRTQRPELCIKLWNRVEQCLEYVLTINGISDISQAWSINRDLPRLP